jgi:Tfp pilus assembly protein PilF
MSLIHQALKKVQTNQGDNALPLYQEPALRGQGSGSRSRKIFLLISLFCLLFAVIAGWTIIMRQTNNVGVKDNSNDVTLTKNHVNTAVLITIDSKAKDQEINSDGNRLLTAWEEAKNRNLHGIDLYKQGKFSLAKGEFLSSIKIFPEYAEAYNNLGLTYKQLGDMKGAADSYKKALHYRSDYPEALNNYGVLLEAKGDSKTAKEYFKKAILTKPDYPEPYLNMAVSLEKGKRFEEAITYYEGFLSQRKSEDNPLTKEVRERILYLRLKAEG